VLFSEPKIPQPVTIEIEKPALFRFSALQRAENSSTAADPLAALAAQIVSVLFSEPKIPQLQRQPQTRRRLGGFSALQRAENSSTERPALFVCLESRFSALQRAENSSTAVDVETAYERVGFSALQRAENSSTGGGAVIAEANSVFQCSSASRKFLNTTATGAPLRARPVSVLFSEPKIPQPRSTCAKSSTIKSFSALQRAENSSTLLIYQRRGVLRLFQCSSASRKFLNRAALVGADDA